MMLLLFLLLFVLSALFYASYSIEAGVYMKSFCRNKKAGRVVSLTFDDGVDPIQTERVLKVLRTHNVKGLFFIIGYKAEQYPELVRRIVEEGHLVGNHSYSHSWLFPLKSTKSVVEELERTNAIICSACSLDKVEYFRPPFGVTNPNIAKAVKSLNLTSIGWSIRSFDTNMKVSRERIKERVLSKLKNGAVILLHDVLIDSDVLLEQIICGIKEQNYRIESLKVLKNKQL